MLRTEYESGYGKKDPMRANARKLFGNTMNAPEKPSKAMPFKKGGHAKTKYNLGGAIQGQADAPPPFVSPMGKDDSNTQVLPSISSQMPAMKKGGKAMKKGACKKMAIGGVGKIRHNQMTRKGSPKSPKNAGK